MAVLQSLGWLVCQWSSDDSLWYWEYNVWDYTHGKWGKRVPYVCWTVAASDMTIGALSTSGGLVTLGVLTTLGLVAPSLLVRRSRGG